MNRAHRPGTAAAPVALAVLAVFAEAVIGGRVFFERDIHAVWYPRVESMVRAVADGAWPLWDPYAAFGLPALADPSYQIAYPPTWLNLVLFPAAYYRVYALGHCFAAGLGLCLLLRRHGLGPWPSVLGGVGWCTSGVLLSFVNVLHHLAGLAWLPWILLALDRALERPGWRAAVVLGAAGAGQVLAGSGDMCLITGLIALGYLGAAWPAERRPRTLTAGRAALGLAVAATAALLLSAAQWLPTAANLATGSRLRLPAEANTYWSLHPLSLLDTVAVRAVEGFPLAPGWRALLFEGREPFLASLYLGVPLLVLAGTGALLGEPRLRLFALAGATFFLLAALGRHSPVYDVILRVPPASLMRYPVKHMIAVAFFVAILAALGAAGWGREWTRRERGLAVVMAALAAAGALVLAAGALIVRVEPRVLAEMTDPGADPSSAARPLWRAALGAAAAGALLFARARRDRPDPWTPSIAVLVAVADLVLAGRGVNRLAPASLMDHRPPVLQALPRGSGQRVHVVQAGRDWLVRNLSRGPAGWQPEWRWALGLQETLVPPIGGRWGVEGSFDGDLTGLTPPEVSEWTLALLRVPDPLAVAILQLGNVGAVIHVGPGPYRGLTDVAEFPSVYSAPIRVARVPDPLPRAYVVGGWREVADRAAPSALLAPGLDRSREVVVPPGAGSRATPASFSGRAHVVWRRADALTIDAEASHEAMVVLAEGHHPDWTVTVDGRPAGVLKANTLFRAIHIPPGRHRIEMRFRPRSAVLGLAGSGLGLLALLVTLSLSGRRGASKIVAPTKSGGPDSVVLGP